MTMPTWIGIAGTLLAIGVLVNGWRIARANEGAGALLGQLHMWMGALFVPLVWFIILVLLPG